MAQAVDLVRRWSRAARADALAFAVQALVLVPFALRRFVDGDEGVYAYASRLAVHGHVPYRDFFYEQMPLLPYVYGAWVYLTGESWYSVRVLSALLAVATGTVLHRHVRLRLGHGPALVALGLYVASALVLGYLTIVKTFALTTLLVVACYVLVAGDGGGRARRFIAAGAFLGLAIDTRLVAAAVLPVFAVASLSARRLNAFAAGVGAALVPSVVLFTLGPHAFAFDNIRYHALKSSGGLVGDFHEKGQTIATVLGLEPTDRALGIQFLLLVVACALVIALRPHRPRSALTLATAAALGIASLLPTPTYVQYFSIVVPFLAIAGAEIVAIAGGRVARLALAAGLCVYAGAAVVAARHFVQHDALLRPSLESVREVAAKVDAESKPGEQVLSAWPGYFFGTHAWALPDYTNQFAPAAAAEVSHETARNVRIVTERELQTRIRDRDVRLVVYRNWVTTPPFARWDAPLVAGRYRLVIVVQTARIYRR